MDRFIVLGKAHIINSYTNLKSNMDRFIVISDTDR